MTRTDEWEGLLDPDERIIWQGQPSRRLRLEFENPFVVVFMLVWIAIPLGMVITQPRSLFLGVPAIFLAIGFHFFIGQHFWAAYRRGRTFYTLTTSRAFIAHRGLTGRKLDSYPITQNTNLRLDEGRDKASWFGTSQGRRMFSNRIEANVGFERLDNPRDVYQKLRAIQRGEA